MLEARLSLQAGEFSRALDLAASILPEYCAVLSCTMPQLIKLFWFDFNICSKFIGVLQRQSGCFPVCLPAEGPGTPTPSKPACLPATVQAQISLCNFEAALVTLHRGRRLAGPQGSQFQVLQSCQAALQSDLQSAVQSCEECITGLLDRADCLQVAGSH